MRFGGASPEGGLQRMAEKDVEKPERPFLENSNYGGSIVDDTQPAGPTYKSPTFVHFRLEGVIFGAF